MENSYSSVATVNDVQHESHDTIIFVPGRLISSLGFIDKEDAINCGFAMPLLKIIYHIHVNCIHLVIYKDVLVWG